MPPQQPPNSVTGSTIEITRAASWEVRRRVPTRLLGTLVLLCTLCGCASAAFATYGVWQLALTLQALVAFTAPIPRVPARVEAPARLEGLPDERTETRASAAAPPVPGFDAATRLTSSPAEAPGSAEATENPISIGTQDWQPYTRTECEGVFVYIVTTSEHPRDSAASMAVGKKGPARFRRPGQTMGEWEVLAITDDWTGLNPAVWLLKDHEICRAELAGNPSRVHVAPKPPVKVKKKKKKRKRKKRRRRRRRSKR